MTPRERADRAQQLLNDEVMQQVFTDIRLNLVAQLESTAMGDIDTHHEVALTLQLLKKLRDRLQQYVNEFKVDEHKRSQDRFIDKIRQRMA